MAKYNKKPRGINLVSILMFLFFIAAGYGGYKFGPKYYQALEVDAALESILPKVSRIPQLASDPRAAYFLSMARRRVIETGIAPESLRVYYGPRYESVHADYGVMVEHPWGPPTVWEFHREADIELLPR